MCLYWPPCRLSRGLFSIDKKLSQSHSLWNSPCMRRPERPLWIHTWGIRSKKSERALSGREKFCQAWIKCAVAVCHGCTGRIHQTFVSLCPVQRRVACYWGPPRAPLPMSQVFSFPLLQLPWVEFPSLDIAAVVRGTLHPSMCAGFRKIISLQAVWSSPGRGQTGDRATCP